MFNKSKKEEVSRREFFKDLGLMAGAGAVVASMPWLQSCSPQEAVELSGEKLRVALIGPGSRGNFHLRILNALPNVEVVALCDIYEPHFEAGLKLFPNAKCVKDYRQVLDMKDVEAVFVVTPLSEHEHIVLDAISAGKHVFCEKAMARTYEGCLNMYNAYKNSGQVMFIGQQRLYDPVYHQGMKMIHDGVLGKVTGLRTYWFRNNNWRRPVPSPELERQINWRLYSEYSAGLMTELASHQLQIGNWALGMVPNKVVGLGDITYWKDGREVYDNISLVYQYSNGVKMTYESNIANKYNGLEEEILCDKGTMKLESGRYFLEEATPAAGIMQLINKKKKDIFESVPLASPSWTPEVAGANAGLPIMGSEPVEKMPVGNGDGTYQLVEAFCNAARASKPVAGIVEEAYYSSILSLMGLQAMDEQRTVEFPEEYKIAYLKF